MTWEQAVALIGGAGWPVVALLLLVAFRSEVAGVLQRTREVSAGGVTFKADPTQVAAIVEEGKQSGRSSETIAQQIVSEALVDEREVRIMQSLFGETQPRALNIYARNDFYRPALEALVRKAYVERTDGQYRLSDRGLQTVRQILIHKLHESGPVPQDVAKA